MSTVDCKALMNALKGDHFADVALLHLNSSSDEVANQTDDSIYDYSCWIRERSEQFRQLVLSSIHVRRVNVQLICPVHNVHVKVDCTVFKCDIGNSSLHTSDTCFEFLQDDVEYPCVILNHKLKVNKDGSNKKNEYTTKAQTKLYFAISALNVEYGILTIKGDDCAFCHYVVRVSDDKDMTCLILEALKWTRKVVVKGKEMTLNPPSEPELFPNMNVNTTNGAIQKMKSTVAKELKELTMIWNVSTRARLAAHEKGIFRVDDPRLTADVLGLTRPKKQKKDTLSKYEIISYIIQRSKCSTCFIPSSLTPYCSDYGFIDFETIGMYDYWNNFLSMLGIASADSTMQFGQEEYTCFLAKEATLTQERQVIDDFITHCRKKKIVKLFCWDNHEIKVFQELEERHNMDICSHFVICDLCKALKVVPWVPPGALSFSLKQFVPAMYKLGMIGITWDSECCDGMTAMFESYKAYSLKDMTVMQDIEKYNRVDVVSMMQIWRFVCSIGILDA